MVRLVIFAVSVLFFLIAVFDIYHIWGFKIQNWTMKIVVYAGAVIFGVLDFVLDVYSMLQS